MTGSARRTRRRPGRGGPLVTIILDTEWLNHWDIQKGFSCRARRERAHTKACPPVSQLGVPSRFRVRPILATTHL